MERATGRDAHRLSNAEEESGVPRLVADVALAAQLLKWKPRMSLDEGLQKMIKEDARLEKGRASPALCSIMKPKISQSIRDILGQIKVGLISYCVFPMVLKSADGHIRVVLFGLAFLPSQGDARAALALWLFFLGDWVLMVPCRVRANRLGRPSPSRSRWQCCAALLRSYRRRSLDRAVSGHGLDGVWVLDRAAPRSRYATISPQRQALWRSASSACPAPGRFAHRARDGS